MKNVLVLYNGQSMFTPTVQDYLESFRRYSRNHIHFLHVYYDTKLAFSLDDYDAVILTYSCRMCYLELISPDVRRAVAGFKGLKAAFLQDEYQETNKLREGLLELGIDIVFTCVPDDKISWVYPTSMFPGVRFKRVLTGYVPRRLSELPRNRLPKISERPTWIGYRGRHLGHCWGDLSFYKIEIGRRFKEACERRGIPQDIAWTEEARIYQDKWYPFIASCRTTLGTPSGCNTFDWDGSMERDYRALIQKQPDMTYEEYRPRIAAKEAEIDMGQASPRLFEAAALGTVLVLLEGSYSNVVTPGVDCITVKRDFSNIDEVLDQISDEAHIAKLSEAAYQNIIASGKWSYASFISIVDHELELADGDHETLRDITQFRPRKGYDRNFLEELSLKSPVQYPLSHWLDLSRLRNHEGEGYRQIMTEALGAMPLNDPRFGMRHWLRAKLRRKAIHYLAALRILSARDKVKYILWVAYRAVRKIVLTVVRLAVHTSRALVRLAVYIVHAIGRTVHALSHGFMMLLRLPLKATSHVMNLRRTAGTVPGRLKAAYRRLFWKAKAAFWRLFWRAVACVPRPLRQRLRVWLGLQDWPAKTPSTSEV